MKAFLKAVLDILIIAGCALGYVALKVLIIFLKVLFWFIRNRYVQIFYAGFFMFQMCVHFWDGRYLLAMVDLLLSYVWLNAFDKNIHNESY